MTDVVAKCGIGFCFVGALVLIAPSLHKSVTESPNPHFRLNYPGICFYGKLNIYCSWQHSSSIPTVSVNLVVSISRFYTEHA